jgi:putative ABC transport system ATP-binding protein
LLQCAAGLDQVTSGKVFVAGIELDKLNERQRTLLRRDYIGFVFQSFHLQPNDTILENVMMPLILSGVKPEERKRRATHSLQLVGLGNRLNHKPTELSSGQQQLAAIARALITNPQMLIADEPTGNLDSVHGGEVYQILQKINDSGTTLLVVTHDVNMAHLAKRIVQMSDGKLTELSG